MRIADQIRTKITRDLNPERLDITDDSHKHKGHAGHRPGGESHFTLTVVSRVFEGQSRLARQRQVYRILAEELAGPVHALALNLKTPEEASE